MRLSSSQVPQPTSATITSFVPGRTIMRNGLRSPYAIMRCSLGSELEKSGLSGRGSPVAGSTRRIAPLSRRASPGGRRGVWLRSAPPRAVGFVCGVPSGNGGSAQGLAGV